MLAAIGKALEFVADFAVGLTGRPVATTPDEDERESDPQESGS